MLLLYTISRLQILDAKIRYRSGDFSGRLMSIRDTPLSLTPLYLVHAGGDMHPNFSGTEIWDGMIFLRFRNIQKTLHVICVRFQQECGAGHQPWPKQWPLQTLEFQKIMFFQK